MILAAIVTLSQNCVYRSHSTAVSSERALATFCRTAWTEQAQPPIGVRKGSANDLGHGHLDLGDDREQSRAHRKSLEVGDADEAIDLVSRDHEAERVPIGVANEGQDARVGADEKVFAEWLHPVADSPVGSHLSAQVRHLEQADQRLAALHLGIHYG